MDSDKIVMGLIAAGLIGLVGLGIWAAVEEEKQWQKFSETHNCKVVGKISGSYSTGTGFADGKTVVISQYNPSRTTYRCDDGIDYTR